MNQLVDVYAYTCTHIDQVIDYWLAVQLLVWYRVETSVIKEVHFVHCMTLGTYIVAQAVHMIHPFGLISTYTIIDCAWQIPLT